MCGILVCLSVEANDGFKPSRQSSSRAAPGGPAAAVDVAATATRRNQRHRLALRDFVVVGLGVPPVLCCGRAPPAWRHAADLATSDVRRNGERPMLERGGFWRPRRMSPSVRQRSKLRAPRVDAVRIGQVPEGGNDAVQVFAELELAAATFTPETAATSPAAILGVFERVLGPYAFVYLELFQRKSGSLWFGRDCLGRRSLLWSESPANPSLLVISSVGYPATSTGPPLSLVEVPAAGLYCLDLNAVNAGCSVAAALHRFEWRYPPDGDDNAATKPMYLTRPYHRINRETPCTAILAPPANTSTAEISDPIGSMEQAVNQLIAVLSESVRRRVVGIPGRPASIPATAVDASRPYPKVALLFSGGVDCAVLAALTHLHVPADESIDLINVSFENPRKAKAKRSKYGRETQCSLRRDTDDDVAEVDYDGPDRVTGKATLAELR
ncbi:MAG: hypothetical protein BJ554DRAFT_5728 [Olpidium bornovanus]|uniref:Glutamine amidotransferase type-2 domain-containing protein n=1 Tax=Olpidium bornovanus TaxID=278681 RepID=A0A8H7ZYW5_9FUNG|nr:MAG: hypothetical protein BJ554DRAFT_5728 [Olpidium bornovanus]